MTRYKRRNYFIDKQLQTRYAVMTILLLLLFSLLFVVILLAPYLLALTFDRPLAEQAEAARTLLNLHRTLWPSLGAVILIMGGLSIFVTHRIAGPVYRFRKTLAEVSAGNLDVTIRLRDKDDLKELASDFNAVIGEMRGFVQTLREDHATLSQCIGELETQLASGRVDNDADRELIDRMRASRENIDRLLSRYARQA